MRQISVGGPAAAPEACAAHGKVLLLVCPVSLAEGLQNATLCALAHVARDNEAKNGAAREEAGDVELGVVGEPPQLAGTIPGPTRPPGRDTALHGRVGGLPSPGPRGGRAHGELAVTFRSWLRQAHDESLRTLMGVSGSSETRQTGTLGRVRRQWALGRGRRMGRRSPAPAAISFALRDFTATVTLEEHDAVEFVPHPDFDRHTFASLEELHATTQRWAAAPPRGRP